MERAWVMNYSGLVIKERPDFPDIKKEIAAYLELHIEQGPVLDEENIEIGVVEGVQGISWQEFTLTGVSNHAGTTPMQYRQDAGLVAAKITVVC